jgi:hypothetical protein
MMPKRRRAGFSPGGEIRSGTQEASRDKKLRFTGLWHQVYEVSRLRESYFSLKRGAAPGVDGEKRGKDRGKRIKDKMP